jgi:hypothetical protein
MSSNASFKTVGGLFSVFIPTISKVHTEEIIANYFDLNYVGKVERVDFVEFQNDEKKGYQKAFVHFSPQKKTGEIMEAIEQKGSYRFYPCERMINVCSFKEQNEYWILLKNRNPVPKTELNIDQLAHNQKLLEEKASRMEEKALQMEEKALQMEEKALQMEEKFTKMEQQFKAMIEFCSKTTMVVETQSTNIELLFKISQKTEKQEKKEDDNCESENSQIDDLKADVEERYWNLYGVMDEQTLNYKELISGVYKDFEKIDEKTKKNTKDIERYSDNVYDCLHKFRDIDDKVNRVIDVVCNLTETAMNKEVANNKFEFMRFNEIRTTSATMTLDELLL